jgi:predicted alpha-1,6-mannanase (GH76 family)
MTRNTCANGPAIQMALRLYMATKDEKYLDFAKNLDQFMNDKLRSPEGLYYDNLADNGELSKDIYTYNQGTPIGADVLWYRLTGDKKYLERATQTAKATLDYIGKDDRLWKGSPAFNAIFFRNLLALDQVAPDPRYRQTLDAYLDRAWKEGRDPQTGLFTQGGIGAYDKGNILDQGGMAQLYALQAMPKDKLLDVA